MHVSWILVETDVYIDLQLTVQKIPETNDAGEAFLPPHRWYDLSQ